MRNHATNIITRNTMRPLADAIATELHADLKAGKLSSVGIDEIRAAIAERIKGRRFDEESLDVLEEMTTRFVVEKAAYA
jgi:hypothetical protein